MRLTFPEHERLKLVDLAQKTLWSPEGEAQLAYLRTRKISDSQIQAMRFGFMPSRIRDHELSGRLVMPLYDSYGELVAISSRDIRPNAERKHWHESFDKRCHVYGLDLAKKAMMQHNRVVVVEGQFDVGYMRSIGFEFTVGVLGTALTLFHASLLARYCSNIYLFFDGDKGGHEATARSMKLYRERNLKADEVRFIPVDTPDDKDPDDLTRDQMIDLFTSANRKSLQPMRTDARPSLHHA
jgi:DNA primase